MLPNEDLGLLVHFYDEQSQSLVLLILAPLEQNFPELLPIYGVIGLLEVDEGRVVPSPLSLPRVDLREKSGDVGSCRGALFKTGLVDPSL